MYLHRSREMGQFLSQKKASSPEREQTDGGKRKEREASVQLLRYEKVEVEEPELVLEESESQQGKIERESDEKANENGNAANPVTNDVGTNEPVTQDDASNEPVTQDDAFNQPMTQDDEPVTQDDASNEPVTQDDEPVTQDDAFNEPVTQDDEPVTQDDAFNEPVTQDDDSNEPVTQDDAFNEPVTQDDDSNEPVTQVDEPVTQDDASNQPVTHDNEPVTQVEAEVVDKAVESRDDSEEKDQTPSAKFEERPEATETDLIEPKSMVDQVVEPFSEDIEPNYRRMSFYETIDANEVLPYLIVGNLASAKNERYLARKNVKFILNLTNEPVESEMDNIEYMSMLLEDDEEQDISIYLEDCITFINKAKPVAEARSTIRRKKSKGNSISFVTGVVLVHSYFGVSRTSAIVLAYLMKEKDWTLREAFDFLKQRHRSAQPNDNFVVQLLRYEQDLHNGKMSMTLKDFYQQH